MANKIVVKNIDSLIESEYNPRQLTKKQYQNLKDSVKRFGLVDPVLVNINKDRKDIIIGGHQRVKIAKDLNLTEIPCVEVDLSYDREKELNIRLNRNGGEWDFDILADNFEIEDLVDWGFEEKEIIGNEKKEIIEPEIEISPELFEAHNYVVLYFDNELDWQSAVDVFDIKTVKTGRKGLEQKGQGRVLQGNKILRKLL